MTNFETAFSEETWYQKYKWKTDNDVNDSFFRTANNIASIEKDKEYWRDQFISILEDFQFVPGGRILSNAGTSITGTTYINCFVDGFTGNDKDSIEGIYEAVKKQAQILKSEGGYGFCADVMRPNGAYINGIANLSPGAVKFLELWDKSSEIITAGSFKKTDRKDKKNFIRKGAQMVTMSCWHPDIIDFITAKQTKGRLSKFNMSVLCTDEFMRAVENDEPWSLVFPNYESFPHLYKHAWNGNLTEWNELTSISSESNQPSLRVYHTFKSARELWEIIMQSTYNRNEPGVLFVDTMNRMNNLWYEEFINATNPCGEQILPIGGVCLLGSINLVHFINSDGTWNYEKLKKVIHIAVRFMDNVNDITYVPIEYQKDNLIKKRRIGLGIMGYGSALIMAKVKYGSPKALQMTEELMRFFTNETYKASALLAEEKGAFPLYNRENYLSGEFIKKLEPETIELIRKHGIRNSHLTSIQPTGNTSVLANIVTNGLEPNFNVPGYYRTSIQPSIPEGMTIPKNVDWEAKRFDSAVTSWAWTKEGDEELLVTTFNGKVWKYDRTRGLLKEEFIEDYAVRYLKARGEWDENAEWAASAMNLGVSEHVDTMSIFARYIDSAISKTINLPAKYGYDEFKDVYLSAWRSGIKGITTYREGTMTSVLATESSNKTKERPKELECNVHHCTIKGKQYFVLVGMLDGQPYEVFAGKNGFLNKEVKKGKIIRKKKDFYKAEFEDDSELSPITQSMEEEEEIISRLTSALLRSGADMNLIVLQLEKVGKRSSDLYSFAKSIGRTLKHYIPDGTEVEDKCEVCSGKLIRQDGCINCRDCGWSKCS